MLLDAILLAATAVAIALHLPQLLQTYRTRDVSSFHRGTILLRIVANLLYAAYSLLVEVWILFGTSMMIAAFELALLSMCVVFGRGRASPPQGAEEPPLALSIPEADPERRHHPEGMG